MRTTRMAWVLSTTAVLLAAIVWTTVGDVQAQQSQQTPQRVLVRVRQVKPEMVPAFEDLIKNVVAPALKKAGVPWFQSWAMVTGDVNTRVSVQPFGDYADFDEAPGGANVALQRALGADGYQLYLAKVRQTTVTTQTIVQTLRQDLSVRSNSSTPPPLMVLRSIQLLPGKGDEFTKVMTSDYLPALKKAGIKDYWVYATNFGAPQGQFVFVDPLGKYAELGRGGPLIRSGVLTAEAVAPVNARLNALITSSEVNIYRFLPDLSFGMPGKVVN